jgi:hypothetical protein
MTHDELNADLPDVPAARLAVDALLDGETVDKDTLRAALADQEARDYFVDALLLRQLARNLGPTHFVAPARPPRRAVRFLRGFAAMLVLTTGVAGGYFYGQQSQERSRTEPVEPSLELASTDAPPAPEPTRVIRFVPGVNWTKSNGSH